MTTDRDLLSRIVAAWRGPAPQPWAELMTEAEALAQFSPTPAPDEDDPGSCPDCGRHWSNHPEAHAPTTLVERIRQQQRSSNSDVTAVMVSRSDEVPAQQPTTTRDRLAAVQMSLNRLWSNGPAIDTIATLNSDWANPDGDPTLYAQLRVMSEAIDRALDPAFAPDLSRDAEVAREAERQRIYSTLFDNVDEWAVGGVWGDYGQVVLRADDVAEVILDRKPDMEARIGSEWAATNRDLRLAVEALEDAALQAPATPAEDAR